MLQIFQPKNTIHFMRYSKRTTVLSFVLMAASILTLSINWLNWGLDFTGGTLIEVGFEQSVNLPEVRTVLGEAQYSGAIVQYFGSSHDILIRLASEEGVKGSVIGSKILHALQGADFGQVDMRRIEFVGPNVGAELAENGALAMIIALLCILAYVSLRFEWRLATGAVLSLVHDILITLGIFSFFQLEFDLTVLAALLAIIGYSLNDTIVVFDRIRENFRKLVTASSVDVVDISITQTLSRTLISSLTTLLVLISLFLVGGELIHGFATALLIGIVVGTYSSIYVASAVAIKLGTSRVHMIPVVVEKEGADQDPIM
ncbi:preprotein translocase subunit SecF [Psychromonas sp. CNPT3]|uniref:protein translocase subunit SecF n=1 Tax=Psychromonas sp. CNPT3 TaxID=314282 RepID=UPI00006E48A9|nr:protein translocase subunit SecF [Psychromonas sp. CNPT3]AGH80982.1 preprotein translocase subunit SecF [Psychromonas sp. CNPT3]